MSAKMALSMEISMPILLLSVIVCILAITTHEAAHAWVSYRLGDDLAYKMGRVTLNPIPHIDLMMTIILPAVLLLSSAGFIFGGAKPVPVNMRAFRKPFLGMALVAIAGPLSNLIQAFIWAVVLKLFLQFGVWNVRSEGVFVLELGILINVLLFTFNLIPIPPLDGSRIVAFFLSGAARRAYISVERFGIIILLACFLLVPQFGAILGTCIDFIVTLISNVVGLSYLP
jgi:Zn-dependent protease